MMHAKKKKVSCFMDALLLLLWLAPPRIPPSLPPFSFSFLRFQYILIRLIKINNKGSVAFSKSAFGHLSLADIDGDYFLRADRILGIFRFDQSIIEETYTINSADHIRNEINQDMKLEASLHNKNNLIKMSNKSRMGSFRRDEVHAESVMMPSTTISRVSRGSRSKRISPMYITSLDSESIQTVRDEYKVDDDENDDDDDNCYGPLYEGGGGGRDGRGDVNDANDDGAGVAQLVYKEDSSLSSNISALTSSSQISSSEPNGSQPDVWCLL
jgi:hypothetical protein